MNCFLLLDHAGWAWFIGCSLLGLRSCSRGVRALTITTLFGWLLRFFDKLLHQFVICIVAYLLLLHRSLCDIWRWFSRWLIYSLLWHALVMAQSALARLDYFCKEIVLLRFWSKNRLLLWRLDVVSLCLESLVLSGHLPQLSFLELILELSKLSGERLSICLLVCFVSSVRSVLQPGPPTHQIHSNRTL